MASSSLVHIRGRAILIIIGTLFMGVILILLLGKLSTGFPWAVLFERLWLLLSIVLGLILAGYVYLYFRLSVLHDLAVAITQEQPLDEELVKPGLRMIYSLPAAMALTAPFLLLLGTAVHALDLQFNFGHPLRASILLLTSALMVFCLVASAMFFLLKNEFRPLFLRLAQGASPEILARFDRSWQIPGGRKITFQIPVRHKIFFGLFTLAAVGFWFAILGYSLAINFLESHNLTGSLADSLVSFRRNWIILLSFQAVFGIGLAAGIAWLWGKDLLLPLSSLQKLNAEQAGSAGTPLRALSEDELGKLIQLWDKRIRDVHTAVNQKMIELVAMMSRITQTITGIDATSSEILDLSHQQTEDATTQVAMISEVSASSLELSSTAGTIARHAEQIRSVTEMAQDQGDTGIDLVSRTIQHMEDMRGATAGIKTDLDRFQESTQEIRGILEIIEEISDQINLLSLNAELEAAGSGEAGQRFAVVASEIKRLASGTLSASEQIRRLIAGILDSSQAIASQTITTASMIEESTAMAEDVSNAFIQIFQYIQDITQLVKDIASSTLQQQDATELITDNLREMIEAAANLESDSHRIEKEIDSFRTITGELKTFLETQKETEVTKL
jgi:methyl-accepting chemotaxis protein